jgi:hypothetical protein
MRQGPNGIDEADVTSAGVILSGGNVSLDVLSEI